VIANFWLDEVYSPEEGQAHRKGDVHIHDLDCLTGYCAGWSLRALLNDGFNGVGGRVSPVPHVISVKLWGKCPISLGILQSEWAGAQAFSSFDTYLAPYVFYDQLSPLKKSKRRFVSLFII
jgi:anaerobic ribonucleoside-triphosphate reductase